MKHLRGDWLKWVAAGFALAATASAEYELARAIGMDKVIAAAVPGALDAYVVRALRAHREVLTAVLAMVGVNAASHLVTAGVLAVDWRLITAVSAIAPLVLWRVHALGTPGEARQRALWGVPKSVPEPDEHASTPGGPCTCEHAMSTHNEHGCYSALCPCTHKRGTLPETVGTTPQTCSVAGCTVWGDLGAHERAHASAGWTEHASTDTFDENDQARVTEQTDAWGDDWTEHASTVTFEEHVSTAPGVLDYVPPEWVTPSVPEHAPGYRTPCLVCSEPVTFTDEHGWEHAPGSTCVLTEYEGPTVPEKRERVLKAVPDLPDGYVHVGLRPGDDAYLEQARVLHARGTALRDWKPVLGVGTARAQRLRDYINSEHDASTEEST